MTLTRPETKTLRALASGGEDFGYFDFAALTRKTRLSRREVRRACRSLTRKGFAEFARGLWSEDGQPAGSGYGATKEGRELLGYAVKEKRAA